MKKLFLHPIFLTFIVVSFIILLPVLLQKNNLQQFTDEELRKLARSVNIKPIPKSYQELKKILDNPNNPLTPKKIKLGEKLFNDPILSRSKDISCATCHILKDGGDDNIPTAIGYNGRANPFHLNSPTVLNAALAVREFWDGRAKDVEEQAGGPIQAPFEMNLTPKEAVERLKKNKEYQTLFKEVFKDGITFENIKKAIGAYERTLLTYGPIDSFLEGNNSALSKKAKIGMGIFLTRGCAGCHNGMSIGGQSLEKFPLRETFLDMLGISLTPHLHIKESPYPFPDLGGFRGRFGTLKFRVPILRNIDKTAPYFHNGTVKELKEVVRIMSKYQLGNEFNEKEIDAVVEFLKSLNGKIVKYKIKE